MKLTSQFRRDIIAAGKMLDDATLRLLREERTRFLATVPLNRAKWTPEQVARWKELNP